MMKRIFVGLFLATALVNLTGCDMLKSLPIPFLHQDAENTEEEPAEEEEPKPPSEHDALLDAKPKPPVDNYRPISVKAPDGLKLEGTLYIPGISPYKAPIVSEEAEAEEAAPAEEAAADGEDKSGDKAPAITPAKIQYPLVILYHGLSGDRWDWKDYPRHLVDAGYAVLVVDLRGHGESVYRGKNLSVWREFARSDWDKMLRDTAHLLKFIAKQPDYNMVNTHQLGMIGASIGANVAANVADSDAKNVKALVLLSPGVEYQGIRTDTALKAFKNPVYMLASTEDAYAADSTEQLYKTAPGKKKIKIFQDLGHGMDMLNNDPELGHDILDWLKQQLPPTTVGVGAPATEAPAPAAEEKPEKAAAPAPAAKTEAATPKAKPVVKPAAAPAPAAKAKTAAPAAKTEKAAAPATTGKLDKVTPSSSAKVTAPGQAPTAKAPPAAPTKIEPPKPAAAVKAPVAKTAPIAPATPPIAKPVTNQQKALQPPPPPPPAPPPSVAPLPATPAQ